MNYVWLPADSWLKVHRRETGVTNTVTQHCQYPADKVKQKHNHSTETVVKLRWQSNKSKIKEIFFFWRPETGDTALWLPWSSLQTAFSNQSLFIWKWLCGGRVMIVTLQADVCGSGEHLSTKEKFVGVPSLNHNKSACYLCKNVSVTF